MGRSEKIDARASERRLRLVWRAQADSRSVVVVVAGQGVLEAYPYARLCVESESV